MGETDRGKLGLVLMGGAMLSKSLIQFSVYGWSCVPSLLFTWGQTIVEVVKEWKKVAIIFITPTIVGLRSNNRKGPQPHPSTENWIKDLLSMAPQNKTQFPTQSVSPIRKLP